MLGKLGQKSLRMTAGKMYCLKSVLIRSFFWSVYSCIGTRKTLYLDTFHTVLGTSCGIYLVDFLGTKWYASYTQLCGHHTRIIHTRLSQYLVGTQ